MQGSFVTTTVVTVILIASVFGLFMLFRFAVWWYFGIDERVYAFRLPPDRLRLDLVNHQVNHIHNPCLASFPQ